MVRRLLPLLPALALSSFSTAQLPPGSATAKPFEHVVEWGVGGPGQVRSLARALFSSVDLPSAVGVRGTTLGRANAPAVVNQVSAIDVGVAVADSVVMPQAGLQGAEPRDAVLATALSGAELRFVCLDANGVVQRIPIAHPAMFRATQLCAMRAGDIVYVAGRSQNGLQVARGAYDRLQGAYTVLPSLTVSQPIRDLAFADFGNDNVPEVAVLDDASLKVYDFGGVAVFTHVLPHAGGAVEPLAETANRGGLVLLRRNVAGSGWELVRVMHGVADTAVPLVISGQSLDHRALAAGDTNGDGYSDVAVRAGVNTVLIARNEPSVTPQFRDAATEPVVTVCSTLDTLGALGFGDYDYDGVVDLTACFVTPAGKAKVFFKFGLRSLFGVTREVASLFDHCYYEADEQWSLGVNIPDADSYDTLTVTYFKAFENAQLGKTEFAEKLSVHTYDLSGLSGTVLFGTSISGVVFEGGVKGPGLLFAMAQLSKQGDKTQKPIHCGGGAANVAENPAAQSPWLDANKAPGEPEKEIRRETPVNPPLPPGRKRIGSFSPVPLVPGHID
jgi:hypothetical protein